MPAQQPLAAPRRAATRYFDIEILLDIVGAFPPAAAADLLDRFALELPLHALAIEQANERADFSALGRRIHTMRGTSLTFGCVGLSAICDDVQACAVSVDPAALARVVGRLTAANADALAELHALRAPGGLLGI